MASQLERLKEMLAALELKHGSDNPFVKDLKRQISEYGSRSAVSTVIGGMRQARPE